ncbi:anoctamin-4-like [Watersipora subatra]|uniref:anoctamin-4-like n=1 Tax=Watersipora subatra TaxID=2589382 RepID=UPI00355C2BDE
MESYENAEQVRPEYEAKASNFRINPVTKKIEPYTTKLARFRKIAVSFSVVVLLLALAGGIFLGVITYRIVLTQFYVARDNRPVDYAKLLAAGSGSVINLLVISLLDIVYFHLAQRLTAWENHRTESEHERSLTFKLFLFQCVNYYSAIVYIALFKGKFIGRPGAYVRMLGLLRAEECDLAGCFIEFSIMCITVMLGKQIFALFYEIGLYPYIVSKIWMNCSQMTLSWSGIKSQVSMACHNLIHSLKRNKIGTQYTPEVNKSRWEKDNELEALPEYGLLYEYLELGIWDDIFKAVSKLSIFVNAVILAWTSDIINKLLFVIGHCDSDDSINSPHLSGVCRRMWDSSGQIRRRSFALDGYIRYTLSKFDVNDWEPASRPINNGTSLFGEEVRYCFYKDFRYGPDSSAKYELTKEYWHVLASKLAFVVCFEQTLILLIGLLSLCISSRSATIEAQRQRARFLANEAIHDLERERSRQQLHQRKRSALNRINFDDGTRYI